MSAAFVRGRHIAAAFRTAFEAAKAAHGNKLGFYPDGHDGQRLGIASAENNCKKIITAHIMRHMTADEVKARGRYVKPDGAAADEIMDWLSTIQAHL